MRPKAVNPERFAAAVAVALLTLAACRPAGSPEKPATGEAPASTPLPTRQTTIDPVTKKLEAAERDNERRRSEIEKAGQ